MVSIIPTYVYSLFAALIVGSIIVYCCGVATLNIRTEATNQQLTNIENYVAAQSLTLLGHTTENNQNTTQFLEIPSQIGNQLFWISLANDSSGAWIESGYGSTITGSSIHVAIPAKIMAEGSFISGSGRPVLQCHFEDEVATLTLTSE